MMVMLDIPYDTAEELVDSLQQDAAYHWVADNYY
jgi:hypothetical protein